MLLGNLLQALYNTVDAVWVGRFLGPEALAAVSVSFPVVFILVTLVMGIVMATTVMVAQYAGANQVHMVKRTINNSLLLLVTGGLAVSALGIALHRNILLLIKTPPEILADASGYLTIFLAGIPLMMGYNVFGAILRGLGDSRTPLLFLAYSTVTNIILDPLFIFGIGPFPRMGVQGAAVATVISQGVATVLAIRHLNRKNHLLTFNPADFRFDREMTHSVIRIGLPAGLQQLVVSAGALVLVSIVNQFGHTLTAAFGSGMRLDQFTIMPAMSLGLAISAMVGQNLGAGRHLRVKQTVYWGVMLSGAMALTISILVFGLAPWLMLVFTRDPAVQNAGVSFLRTVSLSYVPVALLFAFNGVMRGAGDTLPAMLISVASLWLIRLPLAAYLSATALGAFGIWIAIVASSVVGSILSAGYYCSGRWKQKVLVNTEDPAQDPRPVPAVPVVEITRGDGP